MLLLIELFVHMKYYNGTYTIKLYLSKWNSCDESVIHSYIPFVRFLERFQELSGTPQTTFEV